MKLPGIPEAIASANIDDGSAQVVIDESTYSLDAVYGAAFVFIDRAYVFIDRPDSGKYRIVLAPKKGPADEAVLRPLVGELANELLACAYRAKLTKENRATIEAVTMQAIAGAMGPPSLDELEGFDFTEEPFEDPLGIAQSWEEKYQKKKPAGEGGESTG